MIPWIRYGFRDSPLPVRPGGDGFATAFVFFLEKLFPENVIVDFRFKRADF
jgi:hypothetical protein